MSIAVFNLAVAWAQLSTSTARAAVLTFTMPMMSALLARFVLGERLDGRRALALLLGGLGVAVLACRRCGRRCPARIRPRCADWCSLTAAFGWAAGTVCLKRWLAPGDRVVVTAWQLSIGALCAGRHAAGGRVVSAARLERPGRGALTFHIVLGTAAAYWLWFVLSERISATTASLTTLAVPVVGVLGAMALVGDRPAAQDWWGFALVLAGAALTVLGSVGAAARRA